MYIPRKVNSIDTFLNKEWAKLVDRFVLRPVSLALKSDTTVQKSMYSHQRLERS